MEKSRWLPRLTQCVYGISEWQDIRTKRDANGGRLPQLLLGNPSVTKDELVKYTQAVVTICRSLVDISNLPNEDLLAALQSQITPPARGSYPGPSTSGAGMAGRPASASRCALFTTLTVTLVPLLFEDFDLLIQLLNSMRGTGEAVDTGDYNAAAYGAGCLVLFAIQLSVRSAKKYLDHAKSLGHLKSSGNALLNHSYFQQACVEWDTLASLLAVKVSDLTSAMDGLNQGSLFDHTSLLLSLLLSLIQPSQLRSLTLDTLQRVLVSKLGFYVAALMQVANTDLTQLPHRASVFAFQGDAYQLMYSCLMETSDELATSSVWTLCRQAYFGWTRDASANMPAEIRVCLDIIQKLSPIVQIRDNIHRIQGLLIGSSQRVHANNEDKTYKHLLRNLGVCSTWLQTATPSWLTEIIVSVLSVLFIQLRGLEAQLPEVCDLPINLIQSELLLVERFGQCPRIAVGCSFTTSSPLVMLAKKGNVKSHLPIILPSDISLILRDVSSTESLKAVMKLVGPDEHVAFETFDQEALDVPLLVVKRVDIFGAHLFCSCLKSEIFNAPGAGTDNRNRVLKAMEVFSQITNFISHRSEKAQFTQSESIFIYLVMSMIGRKCLSYPIPESGMSQLLSALFKFSAWQIETHTLEELKLYSQALASMLYSAQSLVSHILQTSTSASINDIVFPVASWGLTLTRALLGSLKSEFDLHYSKQQNSRYIEDGHVQSVLGKIQNNFAFYQNISDIFVFCLKKLQEVEVVDLNAQVSSIINLSSIIQFSSNHHSVAVSSMFDLRDQDVETLLSIYISWMDSLYRDRLKIEALFQDETSGKFKTYITNHFMSLLCAGPGDLRRLAHDIGRHVLNHITEAPGMKLTILMELFQVAPEVVINDLILHALHIACSADSREVFLMAEEELLRFGSCLIELHHTKQESNKTSGVSGCSISQLLLLNSYKVDKQQRRLTKASIINAFVQVVLVTHSDCFVKCLEEAASPPTCQVLNEVSVSVVFCEELQLKMEDRSLGAVTPEAVMVAKNHHEDEDILLSKTRGFMNRIMWYCSLNMMKMDVTEISYLSFTHTLSRLIWSLFKWKHDVVAADSPIDTQVVTTFLSLDRIGLSSYAKVLGAETTHALLQLLSYEQSLSYIDFVFYVVVDCLSKKQPINIQMSEALAALVGALPFSIAMNHLERFRPYVSQLLALSYNVHNLFVIKALIMDLLQWNQFSCCSTFMSSMLISHETVGVGRRTQLYISLKSLVREGRIAMDILPYQERWPLSFFSKYNNTSVLNLVWSLTKTLPTHASWVIEDDKLLSTYIESDISEGIRIMACKLIGQCEHSGSDLAEPPPSYAPLRHSSSVGVFLVDAQRRAVPVHFGTLISEALFAMYTESPSRWFTSNEVEAETLESLALLSLQCESPVIVKKALKYLVWYYMEAVKSIETKAQKLDDLWQSLEVDVAMLNEVAVDVFVDYFDNHFVCDSEKPWGLVHRVLSLDPLCLHQIYARAPALAVRAHRRLGPADWLQHLNSDQKVEWLTQLVCECLGAGDMTPCHTLISQLGPSPPHLGRLYNRILFMISDNPSMLNSRNGQQLCYFVQNILIPVFGLETCFEQCLSQATQLGETFLEQVTLQDLSTGSKCVKVLFPFASCSHIFQLTAAHLDQLQLMELALLALCKSLMESVILPGVPSHPTTDYEIFVIASLLSHLESLNATLCEVLFPSAATSSPPQLTSNWKLSLLADNESFLGPCTSFKSVVEVVIAMLLQVFCIDAERRQKIFAASLSSVFKTSFQAHNQILPELLLRCLPKKATQLSLAQRFLFELVTKFLHINFWNAEMVLEAVHFICSVTALVAIKEAPIVNILVKPLIPYDESIMSAMQTSAQFYQEACRQTLAAFLLQGQTGVPEARVLKTLNRAISLFPFWLKVDSVFVNMKRVIQLHSLSLISSLKTEVDNRIQDKTASRTYEKVSGLLNKQLAEEINIRSSLSTVMLAGLVTKHLRPEIVALQFIAEAAYAMSHVCGSHSSRPASIIAKALKAVLVPSMYDDMLLALCKLEFNMSLNPRFILSPNNPAVSESMALHIKVLPDTVYQHHRNYTFPVWTHSPSLFLFLWPRGNTEVRNLMLSQLNHIKQTTHAVDNAMLITFLGIYMGHEISKSGLATAAQLEPLRQKLKHIKARFQVSPAFICLLESALSVEESPSCVVGSSKWYTNLMKLAQNPEGAKELQGFVNKSRSDSSTLIPEDTSSLVSHFIGLELGQGVSAMSPISVGHTCLPADRLLPLLTAEARLSPSSASPPWIVAPAASLCFSLWHDLTATMSTVLQGRELFGLLNAQSEWLKVSLGVTCWDMTQGQLSRNPHFTGVTPQDTSFLKQRALRLPPPVLCDVISLLLETGPVPCVITALAQILRKRVADVRQLPQFHDLAPQLSKVLVTYLVGEMIHIDQAPKFSSLLAVLLRTTPPIELTSPAEFCGMLIMIEHQLGEASTPAEYQSLVLLGRAIAEVMNPPEILNAPIQTLLRSAATFPDQNAIAAFAGARPNLPAAVDLSSTYKIGVHGRLFFWSVLISYLADFVHPTPGTTTSPTSAALHFGSNAAFSDLFSSSTDRLRSLASPLQKLNQGHGQTYIALQLAVCHFFWGVTSQLVESCSNPGRSLGILMANWLIECRFAHPTNTSFASQLQILEAVSCNTLALKGACIWGSPLHLYLSATGLQTSAMTHGAEYDINAPPPTQLHCTSHSSMALKGIVPLHCKSGWATSKPSMIEQYMDLHQLMFPFLRVASIHRHKKTKVTYVDYLIGRFASFSFSRPALRSFVGALVSTGLSVCEGCDGHKAYHELSSYLADCSHPDLFKASLKIPPMEETPAVFVSKLGAILPYFALTTDPVASDAFFKLIDFIGGVHVDSDPNLYQMKPVLEVCRAARWFLLLNSVGPIDVNRFYSLLRITTQDRLSVYTAFLKELIAQPALNFASHIGGAHVLALCGPRLLLVKRKVAGSTPPPSCLKNLTLRLTRLLDLNTVGYLLFSAYNSAPVTLRQDFDETLGRFLSLSVFSQPIETFATTQVLEVLRQVLGTERAWLQELNASTVGERRGSRSNAVSSGLNLGKSVSEVLLEMASCPETVLGLRHEITSGVSGITPVSSLRQLPALIRLHLFSLEDEEIRLKHLLKPLRFIISGLRRFPPESLPSATVLTHLASVLPVASEIQALLVEMFDKKKTQATIHSTLIEHGILKLFKNMPHGSDLEFAWRRFQCAFNPETVRALCACQSRSYETAYRLISPMITEFAGHAKTHLQARIEHFETEKHKLQTNLQAQTNAFLSSAILAKGEAAVPPSWLYSSLSVNDVRNLITAWTSITTIGARGVNQWSALTELAKQLSVTLYSNCAAKLQDWSALEDLVTAHQLQSALARDLDALGKIPQLAMTLISAFNASKTSTSIAPVTIGETVLGRLCWGSVLAPCRVAPTLLWLLLDETLSDAVLMVLRSLWLSVRKTCKKLWTIHGPPTNEILLQLQCLTEASEGMFGMLQFVAACFSEVLNISRQQLNPKSGTLKQKEMSLNVTLKFHDLIRVWRSRTPPERVGLDLLSDVFVRRNFLFALTANLVLRWPEVLGLQKGSTMSANQQEVTELLQDVSWTMLTFVKVARRVHNMYDVSSTLLARIRQLPHYSSLPDTSAEVLASTLEKAKLLITFRNKESSEDPNFALQRWLAAYNLLAALDLTTPGSTGEGTAGEEAAKRQVTSIAQPMGVQWLIETLQSAINPAPRPPDTAANKQAAVNPRPHQHVEAFFKRLIDFMTHAPVMCSKASVLRAKALLLMARIRFAMPAELHHLFNEPKLSIDTQGTTHGDALFDRLKRRVKIKGGDCLSRSPFHQSNTDKLASYLMTAQPLPEVNSASEDIVQTYLSGILGALMINPFLVSGWKAVAEVGDALFLQAIKLQSPATAQTYNIAKAGYFMLVWLRPQKYESLGVSRLLLLASKLPASILPGLECVEMISKETYILRKMNAQVPILPQLAWTPPSLSILMSDGDGWVTTHEELSFADPVGAIMKRGPARWHATEPLASLSDLKHRLLRMHDAGPIVKHMLILDECAVSHVAVVELCHTLNSLLERSVFLQRDSLFQSAFSITIGQGSDGSHLCVLDVTPSASLLSEFNEAYCRDLESSDTLDSDAQSRSIKYLAAEMVLEKIVTSVSPNLTPVRFINRQSGAIRSLWVQEHEDQRVSLCKLQAHLDRLTVEALLTTSIWHILKPLGAIEYEQQLITALDWFATRLGLPGEAASVVTWITTLIGDPTLELIKKEFTHIPTD
eukprot:Blabericola_migrator_1__7280@NODE_36_length_17823_cov_16_406060_g32_i0_p1_GENE_NODE_36_length_17823_cov_16_406060_g32_i0NODE_36_length_17823_cov_16_406060_g32_i0_p1_ORF_typecomplete_len4271_score705_36_NODE_36_length_17823_cov_16_406060_g32_i0497817790